MAHFAKLDEDNNVLWVTPLDDSICNDDEATGVAYLTKHHNWPHWKKTSYNTFNNTHRLGGTPFRGNYAGIGMTYDDDNDIFIGKKPYASWVLNVAEARWQSPIGDAPAMSEEEHLTHRYVWNESTGAWDKTERAAKS